MATPLMGLEVSYAGALLAGLLSFLSPCVLPLVPPYLCFIGGVTFEQLTDERQVADAEVKRRVLWAALAFVLGFAVIFTAFGATASAIGKLIAQHGDLLAKIAGGIIIVLGLHFLGLFKLGFLQREARFHPEQKPTSLIGAFIIGVAFAFGWTPCVGPALAAILFVAGSEDDVFYGASLLLVYALGIGIPFILAALAIGPFMGFMQRFRRYLGRIEQVMGGLLVLTGILFITGSMNEIGFWLLETFPSLGRIG
ncbi:MAG: cytochrome c biogenesis CcdA family protein [Geminicoccales bacterium]